MTDLRVATWNIRKCVGLDRRRNQGRTLSVIAGLGADVVALQEVDRRMGARPATLEADQIMAETGLRPVSTRGSDVSLGWHGNALLLSDHVQASNVEELELPGLEPRGALLADLKRGAQAFRVVAVHLGLTRSFRRRQLQTIVSLLDRKPPLPTLVLGDFNEWSPNRGLEPLSAFAVHAPGRSFHAARPIAALDRIAASPAFDLRDAGVIQTETTRIASDHLPVWARLSVGETKA